MFILNVFLVVALLFYIIILWTFQLITYRPILVYYYNLPVYDL